MDAGVAGLPRHLPSTFLGQRWARWDSDYQNFGAMVDARLSAHWSLDAGLFRSISDSSSGYSDQYVATQPSGLAEHWLIGYPDQRNSSTSGEARLTGRFDEGPRRHDLVLSVRGRDVLALYGGEDARQLGTAFVDQGLPVARPDFQSGPRTPDRNRLWLGGLAYRGEWKGLGGLSVGVQKADYSGITEEPGQPVARRADQPWRYYGAATASLSSTVVLYAGYTQGIEDSGAAPNNATNRGQTLPATRTWQRDAGLRYALTPAVKLVVGVFDVHKPYFNLDPAGAFVNLGDQDHRGVEFSIAGEFAKDLNIVAGVELLNPKVAAGTGAPGAVGDRAVGQGDHFAQLSIDYRLQSHPAWSFDLAANSYGRRAANLSNTVFIPGSQTVDLGSRYHFALGGANASLRLFVLNVGNTYRWILTESAEFSRAPARGVGAYLTVDFQ